MKLRVITIDLNLNAVADDGENLHPVQLPPLTIAATDLEAFLNEGLPEFLKQYQDQLSNGTDLEPGTTGPANSVVVEPV